VAKTKAAELMLKMAGIFSSCHLEIVETRFEFLMWL